MVIDTVAACRPPPVRTQDVRQALHRDGYAETGALTLPLARLPDWPAFAAGWDDLPLDTYMADGGRYRRRRFSCFRVGGGMAEPLPRRPHYQALDHNPLNGGIDRWYEPFREGVATSPVFQAIATGVAALLDPDGRDTAWDLEAHQFRITATEGEAGQPSPEGLHRDGRDWVLTLLVGRDNVQGGVSTVAGPDGSRDILLARPGEGILLDDRRLRHGVSAVRPLDLGRPGYRDMLVLTYARRDDSTGDSWAGVGHACYPRP